MQEIKVFCHKTAKLLSDIFKKVKSIQANHMIFLQLDHRALLVVQGRSQDNSG